MNDLTRLSTLIMAGFFVLSAMSFPIWAAEDGSNVLEEIVVTARKQEESAQDIPIAITALTQELKNSSIRDLSDLNGYAPNMVFGVDGGRGGGGANVTIRGISPTRSDDNSFDSPIAVVIDDIFLGTLAGQVIENFDLERVEILRGPQGTLFGKNTVGGVINVIRSRPTGENGARLKVTAGQDGQREFRAVVNTGLSDNLALKLFGSSIQYDGFMKNVTTGNSAAEKDYHNIGATILWEPNDRFDLKFTAEIFNDEGILDSYHTNYNTAPGVIPAPPAGSPEGDFSGGFTICALGSLLYGVDACRNSLATPSVSTNDKDNVYSLETDAYTLKMTYELNENMTVVSVTGYRDVVEYRKFDFDASAAPFITIERFNEYSQTSQEIRLDGNWENVTLSAGLYYFKNEFEQDWITGDGFWSFIFTTFAPGASSSSDPFWWGLCVQGVILSCDPGLDSIPAGDNVTQILYETQVTTSYAAYGQMDWRFADQWTLTAGVRWTREEKDFRAGQAYLSNEARALMRVFPGGYADLEKSWTEVSPKLGLAYTLNEDSMMYASYAEGFKSGGFFGVNQNIADFVRDQYEPEYANSLEIGYKSQHMDNRVRFNLTWFRNDFEDKQEQSVQLDSSTNTVATVFSNAASVIYSGVELETQVIVNEYFRAFFNYGYLSAEYDEFVTDLNPNDDGLVGAQPEDASHLNPRNAPGFTYGVGGTLAFPVGNGTVEIFGKFTMIDEIDGSLLNLQQAKIAQRDDVSASIGYYRDKWSVVGYGKNLTDERFEAFFPIATLFAAGFVNRPRTFGVEFTYEM